MEKESPPEIDQEIEEGKDLEVVEPEVIPSTGIVKLSYYEQKVNEAEKYLELKIDGLKDRKGYKAVEDARKDVGKTRREIEKKRVEIIAPFKDAIDQVNVMAKNLTEKAKTIEGKLQLTGQEWTEAVKAEQEREAREAQEKFDRRLAQVVALGAKWNGASSYKVGDISITTNEIKTIAEDDFVKITGEMEKAGEEIRRQEQEAAEAAAALKKQQEEEAARLKKQADELEKLKAELEQKAAEQAAEFKRREEELLAKQKEIEGAAIAKDAEQKAADRAQTEAERVQQLLEVNEGIVLDEESNIHQYEGHILLNAHDIAEMPADEWSDMIESLPESLAATDAEILAAEEARVAEQQKAIQAASDIAVENEKARVELEAQQAERAEQLKPDRAKLEALASRLMEIKTDVSSPEAKKILDAAKKQCSDTANFIKQQLLNL